MWRLWNKLFGWDYVFYKSINPDYVAGIKRIYKTYNGTAYVQPFNTLDDVVLLYKTTAQLTWLTCPPEKYISNNK